MAPVVWSVRAEAQLDDIVSHFNSEAYRQAFALNLRQRMANLEAFPEMGRLLPEDRTGTYRELLIGSYRLIYTCHNDVVGIVAVIHGARALHIEDLA